MAYLLNPFVRALDANGDPVNGGLLYVFDAGTTTPVTTFSDDALSSAQPHPVVSNAAGEFPSVFVPSGVYKVRVTDDAGALLYEADNVRISERPDDPVFFDTITDLQADTTSLATDTYVVTLVPGVAFKVAAPGATDHDLTTAGGEKLYRMDARTVQTATALAASPNNTIVQMDGLFYKRTPATGEASATNDLGVDNLVEHAAIAPGHFNSAPLRSRPPMPIFLDDMPGSDNESKLRYAMDRSQYGDCIKAKNGTDITLTSALDAVKGGVHLDLGNSTITMGVSTSYGVQFEANGSDMALRNFKLDCNSNNATAGIFNQGGQGVTVEHGEIFNFTARAIDLGTNGKGLSGTPLRNATLRGLYVHTPQAGVGFPVIIAAQTAEQRVEGALVENCRFWGTDPQNPSVEDYTVGNEYTADYMVFHGVRDFIYRNCEVQWSGSAGLTATRGCENAIIDGILARRCYEPAMNLGASYTWVHIADITGFVAHPTTTGYTWAANGLASPPEPDGANLTGTSSIANRITSIVADETGSGGWLMVETMSGGVPKLGHIMTQNSGGGANSTVSVAPSGSLEAGRYIIDPFKDGIVRNCDGYDTSIQSSSSGCFQAIRCAGDNFFVNNRGGNPLGLGQAFNLFNGVNSVFGLATNFWQGMIAVGDDYFSTGPDANIVFEEPLASDLIQPIAKAGTLSNGTENFSSNLSVSKGSTGVYNYTFSDQPDNAQYIVGVQFGIGRGHFSVSNQTVSGFTLTLRDDSAEGALADATHRVTVIA